MIEKLYTPLEIQKILKDSSKFMDYQKLDYKDVLLIREVYRIISYRFMINDEEFYKEIDKFGED